MPDRLSRPRLPRLQGSTLLTANRGVPLLIFLTFLLLGAAIVDHYGVSWDEPFQRRNGYPILKIHTGQFTEAGRVWKEEFDV